MPGTWGKRKATPLLITVASSSGHSRLSSTVPGRCSGSEVVARALASRRSIGWLGGGAGGPPQQALDRLVGARAASDQEAPGQREHPPAGDDRDDQVVAVVR